MSSASRKNHAMPRRQRGVVLAVAMVVLLGVTVVSITALSSSLLDIRMAGNAEDTTRAFNIAQGAVDAVISDAANFPIIGGIGYSTCTGTYGDVAEVPGFCNRTDLSLPSSFDTGTSAARTERLDPLRSCPPRGMATSCENFKVASFAIEGHHDDVDNGRGRAIVNEGYLVLVPISGKGTEHANILIQPARSAASRNVPVQSSPEC